MSLLEELKEKRQDAIENVAAEDLDIEATNLTLAEHQRVRAFWVAQINDLDKAIAALSPSEALLDPQPEADAPEFASNQDKAYQEGIDAFRRGAPRSVIYVHEDFAAAWFDGWDDAASEASLNLGPANLARQIPEGFTPWGGGERPTDATVGAVQVIFEDGSTFKERSTDVVLQDGSWTKLDPYSAYNIIAYRVVEPSAEAERTSDESQAETVNEQTLITDDIPSIPREEIPIGAAVETYTDSGLETVKISGTTYVVDDEPERQAETQPEAAYAPVNEDEGLMWSNGFQTDAKSKAEPEQDKRPFWTRAPKPKVNA